MFVDTCCCIEPINTNFRTEMSCEENILCAPCRWYPNATLVKCIDNQCALINNENYCETNTDCIRRFKVCNCDYQTKEECKTHDGKWHIFAACLAIGCPKPEPPCCECQVLCVNNECKIKKE